jgi:hypothetical protein
MMRRLLVAGALALGLVVSAAAPATAADWQVVQPGKTRPITRLIGVTALNATSAWAVGEEAVGLSAPGFPLIMRWDGTQWTKVTTSLRWQGRLTSVSVESARQAWAIGQDTGFNQHVLRWNGKAWREVAFPGQDESGVQLSRVRSAGGETWIVGATGTGVPLALRWTSGGFVRLPDVIATGGLSGVQIRGVSDVWVSGFTARVGGGSIGLVAHWDGTAWQVLPTPPSCIFTGVSDVFATTASDVWGGGGCRGVGTISPVNPLLVHWDGTAWTQPTVPIQFGSLNTIAPDDQGRPRWISHTAFNLVPPAQAQYLSYDGQAWTLVPGPAVAGQSLETMQVAHVPGTDATWAVGSAAVSGGSVPRIELIGSLAAPTG